MENLIETTTQTPIEIALGIDENGMTTARQLYEFLELDKSHFQRWAKQNIENNEFYEENKDWWGFAMMANGNECKDYKLSTDFAKHLSMESHSAKGKEARNYFVTVENKAKQAAIELSNLSPELRLLINVEIQQKEQAKQLESVKEEVQGIRDVVAIQATDWRKDTNAILNKIAVSLGGGDSYKVVKEEAYNTLQEKIHIDLHRRLTNLKSRMALEGAKKSSISKMSLLDVIERDRKVLECYISVVKNMAIKYGITVSNKKSTC